MPHGSAEGLSSNVYRGGAVGTFRGGHTSGAHGCGCLGLLRPIAHESGGGGVRRKLASLHVDSASAGL